MEVAQFLDHLILHPCSQALYVCIGRLNDFHVMLSIQAVDCFTLSKVYAALWALLTKPGADTSQYPYEWPITYISKCDALF